MGLQHCNVPPFFKGDITYYFSESEEVRKASGESHPEVKYIVLADKVGDMKFHRKKSLCVPSLCTKMKDL